MIPTTVSIEWLYSCFPLTTREKWCEPLHEVKHGWHQWSMAALVERLPDHDASSNEQSISSSLPHLWFTNTWVPMALSQKLLSRIHRCTGQVKSWIVTRTWAGAQSLVPWYRGDGQRVNRSCIVCQASPSFSTNLRLDASSKEVFLLYWHASTESKTYE